MRSCCEESSNAKHDDHPLNSANDSWWAAYHKDTEVLEQIDKDIKRTQCDIAWFQMEVAARSDSPLTCTYPDISAHSSHYGSIPTRRNLFTRLSGLNSSFDSPQRSTASESRRSTSSKGQAPSSPNSSSSSLPTDKHWEALERILFIFTRSNPNVGYSQGMNEAVAVFYYVMCHDEDSKEASHAEADAYHLFNLLLHAIQPVYERRHLSQPAEGNRSRTTSQADMTGIQLTLAHFMERLNVHDPGIVDVLEKQDIEPTFFAFRWFMCLAPAGMTLPDIITLWDSVFADYQIAHDLDVDNMLFAPYPFGFFFDFTCALMSQLHDQLVTGTFSTNVTLLQQTPVQDLTNVLDEAYKVRDRRLVGAMNGEQDSSAQPREPPSVDGQGSSPGRKWPTFLKRVEAPVIKLPKNTTNVTFQSMVQGAREGSKRVRDFVGSAYATKPQVDESTTTTTPPAVPPKEKQHVKNPNVIFDADFQRFLEDEL